MNNTVPRLMEMIDIGPIRAACAADKHNQFYLPTSDVRRVIERLDAAEKKLAEKVMVLCKECNGTGEVETGIGMMVCHECHGNMYVSPQPAAEVPMLSASERETIVAEAESLYSLDTSASWRKALMVATEAAVRKKAGLK